MKPFQYVSPTSLGEASQLLAASPNDTKPIAGGTDLLGEIKDRIVNPSTLVNLLDLPHLNNIEITSDYLKIGAMTTLTELESYPGLLDDFPALHQAISSVATPQIRNVGTVGGNLCQRPRCWYYRSSLFDCRKKGGTICFAANGSSKYHAILSATDCYIVHPSDLAVPLISLRAEATISGPEGQKTLPLEEFFVTPRQNMLAETALEPGEVLTEITVPSPTYLHRSVFLKSRERQAQDFALASVAVALELSDNVVRDVRITLGGVAPIPLRALHAEQAIEGKPLEEIDSKQVGQLAVRDARPLKDNYYKVPLTAALVSRAVGALVGP